LKKTKYFVGRNRELNLSYTYGGNRKNNEIWSVLEFEIYADCNSAILACKNFAKTMPEKS